MSGFVGDFLEGFGPGNLFSRMPRRGAATQVFATDDIPCREEIEELANLCLAFERARLAGDASTERLAQRIEWASEAIATDPAFPGEGGLKGRLKADFSATEKLMPEARSSRVS